MGIKQPNRLVERNGRLPGQNIKSKTAQIDAGVEVHSLLCRLLTIVLMKDQRKVVATLDIYSLHSLRQTPKASRSNR